jgi:hypothetical protein
MRQREDAVVQQLDSVRMGHRLQPGRLKEGFWSRERGTPSRLLVAFPPLSRPLPVDLYIVFPAWAG